MMAQKWNTITAARNGAISGTLYVGALLVAGGAPGGAAHILGQLLGGSVGGALVFGFMALARNAFVR